MRKITKKAADAFINGYNFKKDNTEVISQVTTVMRLHGNNIAIKENDKIKLNHCGWKTPTTKERLNGILAYVLEPRHIYQKNGVWYWKRDKEFKSGWNKV